jgi:hypothetical protein
MSKYPKPRPYTVKNPGKYLGEYTTVITRSSLETKFMTWADRTDNVLKWASEPYGVPYISPRDGKAHRYFVDFIMVLQTSQGIKKYIVEIKPASQCVPPVKTPRMKQKTLTEQYMTYMVNQSKWEQARIHAENVGAEFIVLTENDLK